jgi:hypothetical protein
VPARGVACGRSVEVRAPADQEDGDQEPDEEIEGPFKGEPGSEGW